MLLIFFFFMLLPSSGRSFIYCGSMIIFHMYWLMYYWWFHNNMLIIFSPSLLFFHLRSSCGTRLTHESPGFLVTRLFFLMRLPVFLIPLAAPAFFRLSSLRLTFVDLRFFLTRRLKKKELERLGCEPSTLDAVRLILRDE